MNNFAGGDMSLGYPHFNSSGIDLPYVKGFDSFSGGMGVYNSDQSPLFNDFFAGYNPVNLGMIYSPLSGLLGARNSYAGLTSNLFGDLNTFPNIPDGLKPPHLTTPLEWAHDILFGDKSATATDSPAPAAPAANTGSTITVSPGPVGGHGAGKRKEKEKEAAAAAAGGEAEAKKLREERALIDSLTVVEPEAELPAPSAGASVDPTVAALGSEFVDSVVADLK